MIINISSGHGSRLPGAAGIITEVPEARRVVEALKVELEAMGHTANIFHDDTATTIAANHTNIHTFHKDTPRDRDVLVHFNAFKQPTGNGTEVVYSESRPEDEKWASDVAHAMGAGGGFTVRAPQGVATLRGAQSRNNLRAINGLTELPTILLEVCFVTSPRDVELYQKNFDRLIQHLARALVV